MFILGFVCRQHVIVTCGATVTVRARRSIQEARCFSVVANVALCRFARDVSTKKGSRLIDCAEYVTIGIVFCVCDIFLWCDWSLTEVRKQRMQR